MQLRINPVQLSAKRHFSWRALWVLVVLQAVGNLLSIPLLRAEGNPIEPVYVWFLWTAVSFIFISISLLLAGRTGLGLPLVEGYLCSFSVGCIRSGYHCSGLSFRLSVLMGGRCNRVDRGSLDFPTDIDSS